MSSGGPTTLADAAKAVGDLLAPGLKAGMGLLGSVKVPSRGCGCDCEIPPPCWAPQPVGDFTSDACPGSKAVLRLTITNCGTGSRTIKVSATNSAVKAEPPQLTLGPYEDGVVVLSQDVPTGSTKGQTQKSVVWIRGCKEHYLRWTVAVAADGVSCCSTEVALEDCPDLIHHWYDHFYCPRPCPNQNRG